MVCSRQGASKGRPADRCDRLLSARLALEPACSSGAVSTGRGMRDIGRNDEARRAWRAGSHSLPNMAVAHLRRRSRAAGRRLRRGARRVQPRTGRASRQPGRSVGHALVPDRPWAGGAYAELGRILTDGMLKQRWDELARCWAAQPPSAARDALLLQLAATRSGVLPPRLLALVAEAQIAAGALDPARETLSQAERLLPTIDDPEILRRLALAAAASGTGPAWAKSYAVYCTALFASGRAGAMAAPHRGRRAARRLSPRPGCAHRGGRRGDPCRTLSARSDRGP